ncbi:MAG TPA: hypothetical protein VFU47_07915, partial [Armatimonadota bacterium]|nr:hypothetical protein [Armatimonadota bacterium]
MSALAPIGHLVAAAGCYVAAWFWTLMLVDAVRRRHLPGLVGVFAGGAVTVALCVGGPAAPLGPLPYLIPAGAAAGLYYLFVPRLQDDWKWIKRRKEDSRQIVLQLALLTGCALFALPYLWMVFTSLKPDDSIFKNPTALPEVWVWHNYPRALQFLEVSLGRIRTGFGSLFLLNTLHITALSMAGMIFSSSIVAFSFARLRWPGRDLLFGLVLATMMLPEAITM